MIRHWLLRLDMRSRATRRRPRGRRNCGLEGLEDRVLLSGNPTVYTVNVTTDNGATTAGAGSGTTGDLRYAIDQANNHTANPDGSVITFDPTVFASRQTITLTAGLGTLELSETSGPEVISGPANGNGSAANDVVVDGNGNVGAFQVDLKVTASLSHLDIANGVNGGDGGGIENLGTLTVASCNIGGLGANTSSEDGGGISNAGNLTVADSFIGNNYAKGNGAGLSSFGTLTITDSVIENNTSGNDGGGIEGRSGTLTVADSLIEGNTAGTDGGGLHNYNKSRLFLSDSTIAGNTALNGGGIENESTMTAVNDTIAYNQAGIGGGVPGAGGGLYNAGGTATLDNTIVARNLNGPTTPDDIPLAISSAGAFNLIGTGGAGGLTNGTNGNQVGVADPGLGASADNGGPTQTIALSLGSPAINQGSNSLAVDPASGQPLATDQRGAGFNRTLDGTVDIGAYEFSPATIVGVSVAWGAAGTSPLQTAADGLRLLPAGRNTDMPWLGIARVQISLNQPALLNAADVTVKGATGIDYGPVTISGSGTSFTIALSQPIAMADRVTITIGGPSIFSYTRRLDVLPGDFNDDGAVNRRDASGVTRAFRRARHVTPSIFGDILGDGKVDARDNKAEQHLTSRKNLKTGGKLPNAVLARTLARQHAGPKPVPEHHGLAGMAGNRPSTTG